MAFEEDGRNTGSCPRRMEYAARGCAKVCESLPFWFGIEISRDKVNDHSRVTYLGSPRASSGSARSRSIPRSPIHSGYCRSTVRLRMG